MELRDYWLAMSTEDRQAFVDRAGTTISYMPLLTGGHRRPSPELARKLVEASDGVLTLTALRPDIWPPQEDHAA